MKRKISLSAAGAILAAIMSVAYSTAFAAAVSLDGAVTARARTDFGDFVDSDGNSLVGFGTIEDSRSAHAEGSYTLGVGTVESLANAFYIGEASFGELRGKAEGGAIAGSGVSRLQLRWQDEFRIVSDILAVGTPVDLRYTLTLHSALFATESCDSRSPPGPAGASAVGWDGAAGMLSHRACGDSDPTSVETVIHTSIGAVLPLSGDLHVGVSVVSSPALRPNNTAIADAFNTARFFVDPIGSNFGYVTASGVSYLSPSPPSPVPEPATWVLGVVGIVALVTSRRGRPGAD